MTADITATVLIPARNEERDIDRCLRAVLAQDLDHDRMEIVLVDGGSSDRTEAVATAVLQTGDVRWRIVDNPSGTTPSNLNAGLAAANGRHICRVDARSVIPPDYVRRCVDVLSACEGVVVTGGAQVAIPGADSTVSRGIARVLNNRFVMGGARYRSGAESGPSDTVYLGAFRADELRSVGGWDEYFLTNQDFELNRRLGRRGTVWFDGHLRVGYLPRRSLAALWQQYYRFGRWKVRYWRRTGDPPRMRQVVPLAVVAGSIVVAGSVVATQPRRRVTGLAIAGLAALFVFDHAGVRRAAGVRERAVGAVGIAVVSTAWPAGVLRGVLSREEVTTP